MKARLDGPLSRLNEQGKLFEGQKLFVQGGALEGCEEALPPLEVQIFHSNFLFTLA